MPGTTIKLELEMNTMMKLEVQLNNYFTSKTVKH